MSFRDNLQHLRATRNMTQEQLAMLLGVSRQSVTKWEAEKSYPEMDKLIKICQLFDCTLDDLVCGDLTARPVEQTAVPAGPAKDICGYDDHWRGFSARVACGSALCVLSLAAPSLLEGEAGVSFGLLRVSSTSALGTFLMFALIALGCALLIPAGISHAAFVREHPFVEDFYTAEDRRRASRLLSTFVATGTILVLLAIGTSALFEDSGGKDAAFLATMAAAVGTFAWGGLMYGSRVNVAAYNLSAVDDLSDSEIDILPLEEAERAELRATRERNKRIERTCGVIMLVATIVGITWLFVGKALDPAGTASTGLSLSRLFWLSWVVGGIGCGLATIAIKAR
ncbi:MAG: helix-turn-helix transcriptional regulator [Tractidigestivibacter sp.]|uniref:helix-turn-helix transcriptional regulator n=1 Tax=Tractidigestivibacter sp. TaxID=2847320 RepID=UPI002A8220DA|nr:helix-turn-helix transcriptional regulator [Tractidigestivibacter sp.]MCI6274622.1 helix-turn-helix transcriptional regulator [Coriobacteriaceae bacterium]MDY4535203.1 helix-turn-helix transcriptional regulator [Tractidigestivibacter sp.]